MSKPMAIGNTFTAPSTRKATPLIFCLRSSATTMFLKKDRYDHDCSCHYCPYSGLASVAVVEFDAQATVIPDNVSKNKSAVVSLPLNRQIVPEEASPIPACLLLHLILIEKQLCSQSRNRASRHRLGSAMQSLTR